MFGNFPWEILYNPADVNPFFTSDFPTAIEESADPRILNRIIPLTPNLAVRILPDIAIDREKCDFTFNQFRSRFRMIERQELLAVNRLLVRRRTGVLSRRPPVGEAVYFEKQCLSSRDALANMADLG